LLLDSHFQKAYRIFGNDEDRDVIKMSPLFEFAAMCLTVLLLHSKSLSDQSSETPQWWTVEQIECQFYDHFGILLSKPADCANADYRAVFAKLNLLFELDLSQAEVKICFKRADLLRFIDLDSIPTCNYCDSTKAAVANSPLKSSLIACTLNG